MRIYRHIIASYVVAVAFMLGAPALLHAGEEPVRAEEQIRAESVSVHTREELPAARRAEMMGKSVYHDRDEEVVVVIDEEGNVIRRIDAEDARVIVNEYTEDFLVARTPGAGEETTVKVFNRKGVLKLDIEVDFGIGPQENLVGTLNNAVITRPFALHEIGTEYKVFRYDQDGKQTLIEQADKKLVEVRMFDNIIWTSEPYAVRKYASTGRILYEHSFPAKRFHRYFISSDGRHLLTCYQPKGERHRRNFILHIEGQDPVEWEGRRPFGRRPDYPVLFRDDEEMIFYRDTRGIKAYDYDGNKIWSVHLPNRHSTYSLASHRVGARLFLSSYEVKEGIPRIAHYSLRNGSLLGITDLSEYLDTDEYRDKLERVPDRFYADDEGNLNIPISDTYITVRFNRRNQ